jgi:hypothetical protein
LVAGLILYALVAHFVLVRNARPRGGLEALIPVLLGVMLALCAAGLLLSKRVPRPVSGESADSFWKKAASPALVAWTPIEASGLLGVTTYAQTGSTAAIAVAGLAVLVFALMSPRYFEGR